MVLDATDEAAALDELMAANAAHSPAILSLPPVLLLISTDLPLAVQLLQRLLHERSSMFEVLPQRPCNRERGNAAAPEARPSRCWCAEEACSSTAADSCPELRQMSCQLAAPSSTRDSVSMSLAACICRRSVRAACDRAPAASNAATRCASAACSQSLYLPNVRVVMQRRQVCEHVVRSAQVPVLCVESLRSSEALASWGVAHHGVLLSSADDPTARRQVGRQCTMHPTKHRAPTLPLSLQRCCCSKKAHQRVCTCVRKQAHAPLFDGTRARVASVEVSEDSDMVFAALIEAISALYPALLPASAIWGYGRPLWDPSCRVRGQKPLRSAPGQACTLCAPKPSAHQQLGDCGAVWQGHGAGPHGGGQVYAVHAAGGAVQPAARVP